jgi:hypothetical protein
MACRLNNVHVFTTLKMEGICVSPPTTLRGSGFSFGARAEDSAGAGETRASPAREKKRLVNVKEIIKDLV